MTDIQNLLQLDQELLLTLNGSNSLFLDGWMTYLTSGFTWIPLYISLLYLVIKNNETMAQILLILGCSLLCVAMADGVADFLVKPLGLHYPLDILCGLLWGVVVGILAYIVYYKIYSRIAPANNYISTQYTSTGYSLSDVDIVELVLVLTIVYTVIAAVVVYN